LIAIIIKAATESRWNRRRYKNRGLKIWNDGTAQYIKGKKQAYLKYLNARSDVDRANYKRKSGIVKRETLKINREYWRKFVADLEYDVYRQQDKVFKILKYLNKETKDNVQLNPKPHNEWRQFYKDLWTNEEQDLFPIASNDDNIDPIILDELLSALTQFKNKKAPGSDGINIELLKEAPLTLLIRLHDLINMC
jgi:hypothetical protein